MQVQLRHIQKRGNSFYFRLAIPADLQIHYGGQREISQSLQTSDAFSAFIKAGELRDRHKSKFHSYRHGDLIPTEPNRQPEFSSSPSSAQCPPSVDPIPTLSEVLNEVSLARPCKYKTSLDRHSAIRLLTDWHGDLPITNYTRKMLLGFRDKGMLRLPPNLYKGKQYTGKVIRSLAKDHHAQTMTARTVNNKLCHISTAFNYALKHGYISRNPAVDLMLRLDKAPSKERDNYSTDQLQRLINALAEQTASGGDVRHQLFWVTLSCLYSGARLNEIAQLSICDLKTVDGIPCFNITAEGEIDKSLKNVRSCRLIPIHPTLIDLGLLRYHEQRLASVSDPARSNLWHSASSYRDGNWGRKVSRWFNEKLRPTFLTDEELTNHLEGRNSYCFHSTRHTFICQAQNQAQMNPRIEMRLTGHADAYISEEHARYGKDMHPSILLKELIKLDYGLDLTAVRGRY